VITDQESPFIAVADVAAENLMSSGCTPFLDDDTVKGLAEAVEAFLKAAGVPVDEAAGTAYYAEMARELEAACSRRPQFIDDGK
jgi:hypothetical protein